MNELLGSADPLATILFEGLWCEADREGRLEDRPSRLRASIFPYRPEADVNALLDWLCAHDFIERYESEGKKLIQVTNFLEHQNPHKHEAPSILPIRSQPMAVDVPASPVQSTAINGSRPADSLIPDSGFLIPDSFTQTHARTGETEIAEWMRQIKTDYPNGAARPDWITGEKNARNAVRDGATWQELVDGVKRYAEHCRTTHRMVLNPARFFGDVDRPWSHLWGIPIKADKPERDAALWAEAKSRAAATNFREPYPQESPGAYMTQIKLQESSARGPPSKRIGELTARMRIGKAP